MFARFWMAVAGLATIMTLLYILLPRRQVTFTAGIAGFSWAFVALRASTLTVLTEGGTEVSVGEQQGVQMIAGVLALVSLIVWSLYQYGEYPPEASEMPSNQA